VLDAPDRDQDAVSSSPSQKPGPEVARPAEESLLLLLADTDAGALDAEFVLVLFPLAADTLLIPT
jgi:hypothetical protein